MVELCQKMPLFAGFICFVAWGMLYQLLLWAILYYIIISKDEDCQALDTSGPMVADI